MGRSVIRHLGLRLIDWLKRAFSRDPAFPIAEWARAEFDEVGLKFHADPPGETPYDLAINWNEIKRVVFVAHDAYWSDEILLFATDRMRRAQFSLKPPADWSCGGRFSTGACSIASWRAKPTDRLGVASNGPQPMREAPYNKLLHLTDSLTS